MDYSTRKLAKWGFTCFEDRLTLKMDHFVCEGQQAP